MPASHATPSTVAATTSAVTLLAANDARARAAVYYDGAATLYLLLDDDTTPSAANFSVKMGDGFFTEYETPDGYTGPIKGVWSAAVGAAQLTEIF